MSNEPNPADWNNSVYLRLDWEGRPYLRVKSLRLDGADIAGDLEAPALPELQWLSLTENPRLTSLRGLKNLPKLDSLWVNNTGLTELNLKGNPALTTLLADRTKLAALDLSGNTSLKQLNLNGVSLPRLDLTGLTKLRHLEVGSPRLTRLEISSLPDLKKQKSYRETRIGASAGAKNTEPVGFAIKRIDD